MNGRHYLQPIAIAGIQHFFGCVYSTAVIYTARFTITQDGKTARFNQHCLGLIDLSDVAPGLRSHPGSDHLFLQRRFQR